jgi:hypothetical protein
MSAAVVAANRREAMVAAVEAYNRAHPESPLPRSAARLLWVMFPAGDVCQRSLETLVAEGFSRNALPGVLHTLVGAGLLSKQTGSAHIPNTYRLSPTVQP